MRTRNKKKIPIITNINRNLYCKTCDLQLVPKKFNAMVYYCSICGEETDLSNISKLLEFSPKDETPVIISVKSKQLKKKNYGDKELKEWAENSGAKIVNYTEYKASDYRLKHRS